MHISSSGGKPAGPSNSIEEVLGIQPKTLSNLHTINKQNKPKKSNLHHGKTIEERLHVAPRQKRISHLVDSKVRFKDSGDTLSTGWDGV